MKQEVLEVFVDFMKVFIKQYNFNPKYLNHLTGNLDDYRFFHNLIAQELKPLVVTLDFSGYGDSGNNPDIVSISYNGENINGEPFYGIDTEGLASLITYDWYNNDGGFGTIILNFNDLTAEVEGHINTSSSELYQEDSYEFWPDKTE